MPNHELNWSTATPGCLIFLVDCSDSMSKPMGNATRAAVAARAIHETIAEILESCHVGNTIRNRCLIYILGYAGDIRELKKGKISEFDPDKDPSIRYGIIKDDGTVEYDNLNDAEENVVVYDVNNTSYPIYFENKLEDGGTNMYEAFKFARDACNAFVQIHPDYPAPVIINVTDGDPAFLTDGNFMNYAQCRAIVRKLVREEIMTITCDDGPVRVFNAAIRDGVDPVSFPATKELFEERDKFARFIFDISSDHVSRDFPKEARACVIGSEASDLVKLIEFGSQPARQILAIH